MTAPVVFIDTETTGLDPERHELWEVALIAADGQEFVWRPRPRRPDRADPNALRINRFHQRTQATDWPEWDKGWRVAAGVAYWTAGMHLVAAVPSFDAEFLARFLRSHDQTPAWHYHLVDVETLAAGKLGQSPPWDSEELSLQLGVTLPADSERHTALGDARWARAVYQAVLTR